MLSVVSPIFSLCSCAVPYSVQNLRGIPIFLINVLTFASELMSNTLSAKAPEVEFSSITTDNLLFFKTSIILFSASVESGSIVGQYTIVWLSYSGNFVTCSNK